MMAIYRTLIITCFVVLGLQCVLATETEIDIIDVLNELRQRIESQDAKIAGMETEISKLTSKMESMEATHQLKETLLKDRIDVLEKTLEQSHDETQTDNTNQDNARLSSIFNGIKRQRVAIRSLRAVPEHEVAFYATHSDHDIHNLGANQVLLFQQTTTNNGNAYNSKTGVFMAPVDGTYVFHATIMGMDTTSHFRAHFDVDGTKYSVFYITAYDQSSQMLVINLNAGQAVTVRNDYQGTGFVGDHHSSFSGFLLYENYPSGTVVGK